jgi:hypothetical protein
MVLFPSCSITLGVALSDVMVCEIVPVQQENMRASLSLSQNEPPGHKYLLPLHFLSNLKFSSQNDYAPTLLQESGSRANESAAAHCPKARGLQVTR